MASKRAARLRNWSWFDMPTHLFTHRRRAAATGVTICIPLWIDNAPSILRFRRDVGREVADIEHCRCGEPHPSRRMRQNGIVGLYLTAIQARRESDMRFTWTPAFSAGRH